MIILYIMLAIIFVLMLCFWVSYSTHIYMNKKEKQPYDYVTLNTFIREFNKYKDDPDLQKNEWNNKSIFLRKNDKDILHLHADIVRINGKCMIFYPIDWIKYCIWMRQFQKVNSNRVKGLWNEN